MIYHYEFTYSDDSTCTIIDLHVTYRKLKILNVGTELEILTVSMDDGKGCFEELRNKAICNFFMEYAYENHWDNMLENTG